MIKSFLLAFLSFSFGSTMGQLSPNARDALLEGNFFAAQTILNTIEKDEPTSPLLPLYRGYIEQAMGHFGLAGKLFQTAYTTAQDDQIVQEILLAECTNAILENKPKQLSALLERLRQIPKLTPHLLLFDGVMHYFNGEYCESTIALRSYKEALKGFEKSAWIDFVVERNFPCEKLDLYIAHALIEEGKFGVAREQLAGMQDEKAAPFLALSYLCEGSLQPQSEKESFSKLATFYFDRTFDVPAIARERLIFHIQNEVRQGDVSLCFVRLLERLKADKALQMCATRLAQSFFDGAKIEDFSTSPLFVKLLNQQLVEGLRKQEPKLMASSYRRLVDLGLATDAMKRDLAGGMSCEIVSGVVRDDEELERTSTLLDFWIDLAVDSSARIALGTELLHQGKMLWLKEGEEKKGGCAMQLGLELFPAGGLRTEQERNLSRFFENLYMLAEKSNLICRLLLIHEAMETLSIGFSHPPSSSTVANYIADAAYLFKARNYVACSKQSELIMKMEPENMDALRYFGLSLYHMGEYKRAMLAIKRLREPDEYAEKALMLCMAHTSRDTDHLVQVDRLDDLSDDE